MKIVSSFTRSQVVLNLNEFLSSVEYKSYFEECGKPNVAVPVFPGTSWKSDFLFGYPHSSKYIILCSAQEIN